MSKTTAINKDLSNLVGAFVTGMLSIFTYTYFTHVDYHFWSAVATTSAAMIISIITGLIIIGLMFVVILISQMGDDNE